MNPTKETIHLLGDKIRVLASTVDTAGAMTVVEVTAAPGGGPPLHTHLETEVFACLEGEVELTVDEHFCVIGPGQAAVAPSNVPHTYRNATSAPARMIVSITPGGMEIFFAELAQATQSGPPNMALVAEIAGRYGVHFVAPPSS